MWPKAPSQCRRRRVSRPANVASLVWLGCTGWTLKGFGAEPWEHPLNGAFLALEPMSCLVKDCGIVEKGRNA